MNKKNFRVEFKYFRFVFFLCSLFRRLLLIVSDIYLRDLFFATKRAKNTQIVKHSHTHRNTIRDSSKVGMREWQMLRMNFKPQYESENCHQQTINIHSYIWSKRKMQPGIFIAFFFSFSILIHKAQITIQMLITL
jgi:hypothetical protein